jgi:hypothetical protein
MVFPLSVRSLTVNLFGRPYFVEGKPVCTKTDFLSELGGNFPFISGEQASYAVLCPMMDAEIRAKFPKVLLHVTTGVVPDLIFFLKQGDKQKAGQETEEQTDYSARGNRNHSNGTTAPS